MEMLKMRQKAMPNLWFRLMELEYRTRSRAQNAARELTAVGIEAGMRVVDFGCGPGRYTIPAAALVGPSGEVFAVDVHPLAMKAVEKAAAKERLVNVRTVRSDCATGLEPESVDAVLLFDALHDVEDKESALAELRRVLKPKGRLLYKDHTLNGPRLLALMRENDLRPWGRSDVLSFVKC